MGISNVYDAKDQLTALTNALGETTNLAYGPYSNSPTDMSDAVGAQMLMTYNPFGHVLSETNANGVTTTYSYDVYTAMGRKISETTSRTDAAGVVHQLTTL